MISLCPRAREGYLEVADMWAQLGGYKCVDPPLGFPPLSIMPSELNVACLKCDNFKKMCIFP